MARSVSISLYFYYYITTTTIASFFSSETEAFKYTHPSVSFICIFCSIAVEQLNVSIYYFSIIYTLIVHTKLHSYLYQYCDTILVFFF